MEIEMDISEETAKIPADDNPGYIKLKGPAIGTGTIKMTAIPIDDYALLTSAITGKSKVVAFGEHTATVNKGFSFKKTFFEDGEKSINLIMVHEVVFGIPKEGGKSIDENGTEIIECAIPYEIFPDFYTEGSVKKRRTLTKINSAKTPALYSTLKDKCFTPDEATFAACDVTFDVTPAEAEVVVKFGTQIVKANTDGTYSLTAGSYTYDASADGYTAQSDVALEISESDVTAGAKTEEITLSSET